MPLSARQQTLIDDLSLIEDPQERLAAAIDRARKRPALPAEIRTEANRVAGCQSQVWLIAEGTAEKVLYLGDSDSPLVRGLVVLICDFFSDESAKRLLALDESIDPVALLGLSRNLSSTRQSGLAAVRSRLRALAQLKQS